MNGSLVVRRWRSGRQRHLLRTGYRPACLVQFADRLDLSLLLHAAVLEPDLDLTFGERQLTGQLDASAARQVAVELEVLLQLQCLEAGVRLSTAASLRRVGTCTRHTHTSVSTAARRFISYPDRFIIRLFVPGVLKEGQG